MAQKFNAKGEKSRVPHFAAVNPTEAVLQDGAKGGSIAHTNIYHSQGRSRGRRAAPRPRPPGPEYQLRTARNDGRICEAARGRDFPAIPA